MASTRIERKRETTKDSGVSSSVDRLKVVVRRLPANLPEDVFWGSVQQWVTDETSTWRVFYPGKLRTRLNKENIPSRAYINFKNEDVLAMFSNAYDGHLFRDKSGKESIAIVEFAPYQKIPTDKKKIDARNNTIDKDEDYLSFLESLKSTSNREPTTIESLMAANVPPPGPKTTPLLEALKAQASNRAEVQAARAQAQAAATPAVAITPAPKTVKAIGKKSKGQISNAAVTPASSSHPAAAVTGITTVSPSVDGSSNLPAAKSGPTAAQKKRDRGAARNLAKAKATIRTAMEAYSPGGPLTIKAAIASGISAKNVPANASRESGTVSETLPAPNIKSAPANNVAGVEPDRRTRGRLVVNMSGGAGRAVAAALSGAGAGSGSGTNVTTGSRVPPGGTRTDTVTSDNNRGGGGGGGGTPASRGRGRGQPIRGHRGRGASGPST